MYHTLDGRSGGVQDVVDGGEIPAIEDMEYPFARLDLVGSGPDLWKKRDDIAGEDGMALLQEEEKLLTPDVAVDTRLKDVHLGTVKMPAVKMERAQWTDVTPKELLPLDNSARQPTL